MSKHAAEYKKREIGVLAPFTPSTRSIAPRCGLKMEVVMIPDKCGREKTVGLRFLSSTGYNAPTV